MSNRDTIVTKINKRLEADRIPTNELLALTIINRLNNLSDADFAKAMAGNDVATRTDNIFEKFGARR